MQQAVYDPFELSCALKPPFFRLLLDRGASAVVFTDTDTCFYAPVDDLADIAAAAGLAVFPHAVRPAPERRYLPLGQIEYQQMVGGLFNLGFIAVGRRGDAFLDWWGDRLARDCLRERPAGLWTDETWVDWAPVYFEHTIVRDTSVNVAYWNLDERELHEIDGKPAVDGALLRHFHFAGFDPRRPELLSSYVEEIMRGAERSWPSPPANHVLARLLGEYAERLLEDGSEELRERPYRFGFSAGGRSLGLRERAVYREAVIAAETRDTDPPPNPFDSTRTHEFERLVDDPGSLHSLRPGPGATRTLRPPGISRSSLTRTRNRLLPAARYALTGRHPPEVPSDGGESDVVRLEYRREGALSSPSGRAVGCFLDRLMDRVESSLVLRSDIHSILVPVLTSLAAAEELRPLATDVPLE